ncbi:nucleotide exchange factor GrpE [Saccharospirillum sp. MSK14-1]|uniref:nucleotide exchange factor GrpE n=1 Tax=Saccharospirillum sp. MSK14-1 TaxID=1897632 RepID=UPI000D4CD7BA|nr:nucleotide exchange factor GrpE [Saccharospirillum sp. MSK14-1]PTY38348.1 nucleotide exchange factor GrpE [Saccharospirillum sp. MSK14-1]
MASEDKSVETQDDVAPTEAAPEAAAAEEAATADLAEQLAAAQQQAKENHEQYLRAEAEMANLRRRVEKDVENAHKFGQEKLVKEMLTVADNLERTLAAIETETDEVAPLKEGVEMTLKGLLDTFEKLNVEVIDPQGHPFDPQLHQAMSMVENPDVEPNTVIAVMQKGYTLHERLVRPAMVMVSKGSGGGGQSIDETA